MAHVIHGPFQALHPSQSGSESSAQETPRAPLSAATVVLAIVLVLMLTAMGIYLVSVLSGHSAVAPVQPTPITAKAAAPIQAVAPLSAAELKAVQARDDYAVSLTKLLRQQLPEYKRVTIYADNWAGTHAPTVTAPRNTKARTGDNLMMVFWSPENGTARGLGDFTKSKAAQQGVVLGFEEFQFVDPGTYCFALVAPTTGVGPLTCGIR